MATYVPKEFPPKNAPGKDVARTIRQIPHIVKARRDAGDWSGDAVETLIEVPANTMVMEIKVWVEEAFTASTTLRIGDGSDNDRFLDTTAVGPTATGWKSSFQDAQPGSGGHIYTATDTIDIDSYGATPTAGTIHIYAFLLYDVHEVVENYNE